jgi:hypothetical protein
VLVWGRLGEVEGNANLAIHFQPEFSLAFYFDCYSNPASVPNIQDLIRRCSIVCHYKPFRLQVPTTTLCGHYCCLFVLYIDRDYTPQHFVALFNDDIAYQEVERLFESESGGSSARCVHRGSQCCASANKR